MNRLAIITSFLGGIKNRYMTYQEDRSLEEKFLIASKIEGIDGLELCFPSDFEDIKRLRVLLEKYNFSVSAINFRSRQTGKWWRGSLTSTSLREREEFIDKVKKAMDAAAELGCNRLTTCPLNDGTDYIFEMDYMKAYDYAAETLLRVCNYNREIRVCLEYKESDPRARCLFGNAGEAASFCQMVGAENLGVTLDIGHSIYTGERPAQAATLLTKVKRLFYVHLNDNDGRWDWDMIPGAYHMWEFIETFYYLRKSAYDNDWYAFDVFPKEIDTVETFRAAVRLTRKLEALTDRLNKNEIGKLLEERNPSKTILYLYSLL